MPKLNKLRWNKPGSAFVKWCKGQTGCPIVDAGMRQLNMTGFMHNRVRMIVAMYLIWYLQIHWKHGEKYFAQHLTDYSYCNNYGGWTWCASTEVYSNPYFKPFNIDRQAAKYDKGGEYTSTWLPKSYNSVPLITNMKEIRKKRIKEYKRLLA
jgi:deoxyribodipyrimidine photo-lyase